MLEVTNLTLRVAATGLKAVDGIHFCVAKGETVALVGESGSGKSLTALAMLRLLPAGIQIEEGHVFLDKTDLFALSEAHMRRVRGGRMAMIFQEPATALNPILRVGDQIIESLRLHTSYRGRALRERAIWWLDKVGIEQAAQRIDDYPFQFSGGQRQRIMIAMALASEPDILIADEPTTALDVAIQAQILELLVQIQKELNLTVLLITHDLAVVKHVADRVVLMREGKIVEQATTEAFFQRPKHPYAKQLLDAVPSFAKRPQKAPTETNQTLPLLQVNNLSVAYKQKKRWLAPPALTPIVKDVSFDLYKGETLALLGASGCGKSTVAKTLTRLLDDQTQISGRARLHHQDLLTLQGAALKPQRRALQIVFQDPFASLNPRMTVGEILAEGLISLRPHLSAVQRQQRIEHLLDVTALPRDSAQRYAHEFSGGQRQRIAIARALAVEPEVLICDEPTSALDVSVQIQILDLLLDLQQLTGLAYLFITHDFSVVEYIADRVAIMHEGRIVEKGETKQVLLQPQHPVSRRLIQAVPKL